jgi:hypothetical protein
MHHGADLRANLLSEVLRSEMGQGSEKAGKPEAEKIARLFAQEYQNGTDNLAKDLGNALPAQPEALRRYLSGQAKVADLSATQPYPVARGGAWLTNGGRIVMVEFLDQVQEAVPSTDPGPISVDFGGNKTTVAGPSKLSTTKVDQAKTQAPSPQRTIKKKFAEPGEHDGSLARVTFIGPTDRLVQDTFDADETMKGIRDLVGFITNEDNAVKWRKLSPGGWDNLAKAIQQGRGGKPPQEGKPVIGQQPQQPQQPQPGQQGGARPAVQPPGQDAGVRPAVAPRKNLFDMMRGLAKRAVGHIR